MNNNLLKIYQDSLHSTSVGRRAIDPTLYAEGIVLQCCKLLESEGDKLYNRGDKIVALKCYEMAENIKDYFGLNDEC